MNTSVFILSCMGIVIIVILFNYKPIKYKPPKNKIKKNIKPEINDNELLINHIINNNVYEKDISNKVGIEENIINVFEENNQKDISNTKIYIYLMLGLIFLPLLTMFVSIFIIEKFNIYAPYILVITNSFKLLLKTYDIISYIIIIEIVLLFFIGFFKIKKLNKITITIIKYSIIFSIIIFLMGFFADITNII